MFVSLARAPKDEKNRLEAFSDGVLAIIITIMVLELKVPHAADIADPETAAAGVSELCAEFYLYRHLLEQPPSHVPGHQAGHGGILWANLHLLFWLSLFPFTTGWMGENHLAANPDRCLWLRAADGGHRLLYFAAHHHRPARPRLPSRRRRLGRTGKANSRPCSISPPFRSRL